MPWKVSRCEKLTYRGIYNNKIVEYELIKSIEQCIANYANEGKKQYQLPSKYIRELLNITDGDGITYTNKNNEIIAKFFKNDSLEEQQQEFLCVNKDLLFEKLNAQNEMLFWVINVKREPSRICYEKYKNLHVYKDSTWIVWFDEVHQNWQDYCFVEETKI